MDPAALPSVTLHAIDTSDTDRWAASIADCVAPGDVICLWGDVGAGKTYLARALIQTLQSRSGVAEDVPSPTFTLVQIYHAGPIDIWHADLYRLAGPDDVIELGLSMAFDTAVCLIEWPDRLGDLMPADALHLNLHVGDTETARTGILRCADRRKLARYAQKLGGTIID